jgi:hypothetical protein
MFATANPSVGGFDVSVSAILIGSQETMSECIRGVLAPVVTPFKADLSPDSQRFIAHCKWLLSQNCGLAVFGTNSEANSLSMEERAMLLDELVAAGVDPSRMMPGTSCCSIMEQSSSPSRLSETVARAC